MSTSVGNRQVSAWMLSDHIFTLRQILEQNKEWNAPLYANFIDFEKAFYSIHGDSLWKILTLTKPNTILNTILKNYF